MKRDIKNEMSAPYNLKVSEKEKYASDGEWFKQYMRYIVLGTITEVPDYESMRLAYEVANNNLDGFKDKLMQFCNPLGADIGEIQEEVVPYPELHNNINVLKGEMLSRGNDIRVMLLSANAIRQKNEKLREKIMASVDELLAIKLEQQKAQMQGMSKDEQEKYIQSLRTQLEPEDLLSKNYLSEVEIFASKALRYCNYEQDVKLKQMDTFEDTLKVDRCFIYSGWKHGKPFLEIRNPLFLGFHKSPNERFIHKGDYVWYRKAITPSEIFNNYTLTDEQISALGLNSYRTGMIDKRHAVGLPDSKPVFDQTNYEMLEATQNNNKQSFRKDIGLSMTSSTSMNRERHLIWETHFEFKAFKQIIFLSYVDEYNKDVTTIVNQDFEIPEEATKELFINRYGEQSNRWRWFDPLMGIEFTVEKLWIPRKYEIIRLGTTQNVFPIYREVPYQHTNIENPYSTFELSTKGGIFNARNTKSVSPLQLALAPYFQYIFVKHIQNRELSKYQGAIQSIDIDQIPDELGEDIHGNPIRDKVSTYLTMLRRTNKDFYSGSQSSIGGLPPATRSPGSGGFMLGTAIELMNLQSLLEYLKREIGMAMGISPQRVANFATGTNVSDNQQAIAQSYNITEPYFFLHAEIWRAALNDWLLNFRTYCKRIFESNPKLQEYSIHYFLEDGTEELLSITPDSLSHADFGLFLVNSSNSKKYNDYMIQTVMQALAQNRGEGSSIISGIIKDIMNGASPEETHKKIQMAEEKQHKRNIEIEQLKQQAQAEMQKRELENREDLQKHDVDKILVQGEVDKQLELIKQDVTDDTNENNVPDELDIAKTRVAYQAQDLKERQFEHQKEVDNENIKIAKKKAAQPKTKQ